MYTLFSFVACPLGTYDYACREICGECYQRQSCNHMNGNCADGCKEGFKGELCKMRKPSISYTIELCKSHYLVTCTMNQRVRTTNSKIGPVNLSKNENC